jgi:hypothetical protein
MTIILTLNFSYELHSVTINEEKVKKEAKVIP